MLTLLVRCVRGAQLVFFVMTFSIVESGINPSSFLPWLFIAKKIYGHGATVVSCC
jgi:hypothetical protein